MSSEELVKRLRAKQSASGFKRSFPSEDQRHMVLEMEYAPDPLAQEAADHIEAQAKLIREARENAIREAVAVVEDQFDRLPHYQRHAENNLADKVEEGYGNALVNVTRALLSRYVGRVAEPGFGLRQPHRLSSECASCATADEAAAKNINPRSPAMSENAPERICVVDCGWEWPECRCRKPLLYDPAPRADLASPAREPEASTITTLATEKAALEARVRKLEEALREAVDDYDDAAGGRTQMHCAWVAQARAALDAQGEGEG